MEYQNEVYLEEKFEGLQIACDQGDYETAEAIIGDVEENGFEVKAFKEVMLNTPIFNFIAAWAAKN